MRTLLLIHHSHTDVGYTAPQARVARWHGEFIRRALALAETEPGFKWVCECFWGVERFLAAATSAERERLAAAVRAGGVGLSASYLNFSEHCDTGTLRRVTARAADYGRAIGAPLRSAMTADVNGHAWGWAELLAEQGVGNLFSCVHTHHGRYPLDRPQRPFWWETPSGRRLLVWSGEHYHLGNELGAAPGAISSYSIKDDCDAAMIFGDHWAVAERRIPRYWDALERQGHDWDFAPVMVSGLRTDNGPPAAGIARFCARWNAEHGDAIRVEMATLDDFFDRLREQADAIPTHRGDWPDWWSDGPAGDAPALRLHRAAARRAEALRAARVESAELDAELALFAEHTFGHADAMTRPWRLDCQAIRARKLAYAAGALDRATDLLDGHLAGLGASEPAPGLPLNYRAVNPHAEAWAGPLRLPLPHYEFNERGLHAGLRVVDVRSGEELPARLESAAGGGEVAIWTRLAAGDSRDFVIAPRAPGAPAGGDPADPEAWREAGGRGRLATPHLELDWELGAGIAALRAPDGGSLLQPGRPHAPFQPVHELSPLAAEGDVYGPRGAMGLNRKGPDAERGAGRVRSAWRSGRPELYAALAFDIDCPGLESCRLELRAWHAAPRLDAELRFHKVSRWEPENVYLALPFGVGDIRLLKAGAIVRPRTEQIPGTLTDYYALQDGFARGGLALAMPDSPLLQLGPLEHGERLLAGDPRLDGAPPHPYAWLMTNYWETNFAPALGGFHAFRFGLAWGPEADALPACRNLYREVFCFRLGGEGV